MTSLRSLSIEHLRLVLRPVNRALHAAAQRQTDIAGRMSRPEVAALCVTDQHVQTLLAEAEALLGDDATAAGTLDFTSAEQSLENELRQRAAACRERLPLDRLCEDLGLVSFEREAVLFCLAPEIERCYERIYAYVLDDLNRRAPCVELLSIVCAGTLRERLERRALLGPTSRLRRVGLLVANGEGTSELRQELRLAPVALELLLGGLGDVGSLFRDSAQVVVPTAATIPPHADASLIKRIGAGLANGTVEVVGISGPHDAGRDDIVLALASLAGLPLRRLLVSDPSRAAAERLDGVAEQIEVASVLGAMLWVQVDPLTESGAEHLRDAVADRLACARSPVILSGAHPWRSAEVLAARACTEIELSSPGFEARKYMWRCALPAANPKHIDDLAARFRMSAAEMHAVARVAGTRADLGNGRRPLTVDDCVEDACAAVIRKQSDRFATVVRPRRGAADLILPETLHAQVLEIGRFFRSWSRIAEGWGFGHLVTGSGGIKALFTGDSGTGKTLAAEVVAHELGVPLLKVDLARVVSKWVGETEKNLEAAFREAEDSHSVLFFDEADALFGKRSEVQHGTDRYANLEVSYLLQRLEDHFGLVILASNLKDQIDTAFVRRFHVVLHFPRPSLAERQRIWRKAFPPDAPLDADVDLETLARLDMTGAGIVSTARNAALLADDEGARSIAMHHVVRGVARQFLREGRILTPEELGSHAVLLEER